MRKRLATVAGRRNNQDGTILSTRISQNGCWMKTHLSHSIIRHRIHPFIDKSVKSRKKCVMNYSDFATGLTCILSSLLDKNSELALDNYYIQNQEIHDGIIRKCKVEISRVAHNINFPWKHWYDEKNRQLCTS